MAEKHGDHQFCVAMKRIVGIRILIAYCRRTVSRREPSGSGAVFLMVILGQLLALSQQLFITPDSVFAQGNSPAENPSLPEKPFVSSDIFLQQVHQRFSTENGLPTNDIRSMLIADGHVYAGTAVGIADRIDDSWNLVVTTRTPVTSLAFGRQRLWYVENDSIFSVTPGSRYFCLSFTVYRFL